MKSARRFWLTSVLSLCFGVAVFAWGFSQWYLSSYTQLVADRLALLNELRIGALRQYFATAGAELNFWETSDDIVTAQKQFIKTWNKEGSKSLPSEIRKHYIDNNPFPRGQYHNLADANDGSAYSDIHQKLHPIAKLFVTKRGYYDMFLIGLNGDIYYTVEKENDFSTNLIDGPWRDTVLADVYRRAKENPETVAISDMQPYSPSNGEPAIFMARSITESSGKVIGVIAFQLPTDKILKIMNYTVGMRETGETYLVGQDQLMRSNSRFSTASTVLQQTVNTPTAKKALASQQGVEYSKDYRDVEVLSAYTNMILGQTSWAVLAEIDRDEIAAMAAAERPALSGILSFIFGLSLWSIWHWQSKPQIDPADNIETASTGLETSDLSDTPHDWGA